MSYKQIPEQTIVWVANRENPVSDIYSSALTISHGNLVLFNESQSPIWSTNLSSISSSSVLAVLQEDDNLVLTDHGSKSPSLLWQSFDHPTHVWLPGSKFGYNNVTKRNQRIISWKNSEDPAPGLFSLEVDMSDKSFRILRNRSKSYWTCGSWNGMFFDKSPETKQNYNSQFRHFSDVYESYFIYSVIGNSTTSRFVMDVSGQVKQITWLGFWAQPRQQCQVYAFCGAFGSCYEKSFPFCNCLKGFVPKSLSNWELEDYSGGCQRKTKLRCKNNITTNGERDIFLLIPSVSFPEAARSVTATSALECETTCLNDCSCTAYAFDSTGCSIWIGDLFNLNELSEKESTGTKLYVRLAASELPITPKKNNIGILIGVVVCVVAGLAFLLGLIVFVVLRQRQKVGLGKTMEDSPLVAFDYRYLRNATRNFSEKLRGGGFGSVFKGRLPDLTLVAVKQLQSVRQGEKQFRAEISTIGTIQHVNLIRLRGFCCQGGKRLLFYDYMSNGSLDSHLFQEKNSNFLDWKTRYQIALGTARGLFYLHEKCRDCIIHCDIKPENILLDDQFCPKLADSGLAKLVGRDFSRVLTTMRGTRGYLAPEWISGVAITAKADVYSFGIMLFEFLSGRRNILQRTDEEVVKFFPSLAARLIIEGDDETHRPAMGQVVQILEGVIDVDLPPLPTSLQAFVEDHESLVFYTESSCSQSSQIASNISTVSSQAKGKTSLLKLNV
ncbi:hypothetical protein FNV43_RR02023 [Rhamnella rubrinervis]|uniref:Receptor-like serine/threonine-protein kinase n=1 Tax=Rhamnella rubrinervis TaxID=2594499 RepID=A0A8K0HQQ8_9ROSA|nr:hypothetical protein FNV43_RR02023 [Rhamnella rubrinervis]